MFNIFSITDIFKSIPLGFKLFQLLKIRKPAYVSGNPSYIRKGFAALNCFVDVAHSFIDFSTKPEQRREIIFYFVYMSRLIDAGFDSNLITQENLREIMLGNNTSNNDSISKLIEVISRIKKLSHGNPNYDDFLEGIIKTWETHKVRDFKEGVVVSDSEALEAAEARGSFYFLALINILNPTNVDANSEKSIRLSGMWFELIDDYSDRDEDSGRKNTILTIPESQSYGKIFKKHRIRYQEQINVLGNHQHLIRFFGSMAVLGYLVSLSSYAMQKN